MNRWSKLSQAPALFFLFAAVVVSGARFLEAQQAPQERNFPQSKAAIQAALRQMQASHAGHLPTLSGFATADHPFDSYKRGYYQSSLQVTSTAGGGSLVRVTTKITAWYTDPAAAHSGYQVLNSNGRLEGDLLDQLGDQLAKANPAAAKTNPVASSQGATIDPPGPRSNPQPPASTPAAPVPQKAPDPTFFSSSKDLDPAARSALDASRNRQPAEDPQLLAEVNELSEILRTQAHPGNLVAVKKGGTPVFQTADLNAKPLFYASQHDEFEILDFNVDWIHVRISGLSRGWIWRNSVEMPDRLAASDQPLATEAPKPFHVVREETVLFPGDWEPLRGKIVKVMTVQKGDENAVDSSPEIKREFAKNLFDKTYAEVSKSSQEIFGVVLVFDSVDGGMIAATTASLKQWESGGITDAALWHQCFFDPPEILEVPRAAATH